jgi:NADH:ubiquinone oxidoreductase subunit 4 (subunit M)
VIAVVGAIGLVLAPVYMLRMFQSAMYGEPVGPRPSGDIYAGQLALVSPLVILMFAIGLYPYALTQLMTSVAQAGLYR